MAKNFIIRKKITYPFNFSNLLQGTCGEELGILLEIERKLGRLNPDLEEFVEESVKYTNLIDVTKPFSNVLLIVDVDNVVEALSGFINVTTNLKIDIMWSRFFPTLILICLILRIMNLLLLWN